MSDDEDNQALLADIQALENVLSQKQELKGIVPTSTNVSQKHRLKNEHCFENDLHENQEDASDLDDRLDDDESYEGTSCDDLQDLLELNKKLIESFIKSRDKMVCLLDECVQKQEVIKDLIGNACVKQNKIINLNAGMPYFKDKNYYTSKRNEDTETKIRNNELRLTELQRIHRWNHFDKTNLLKAIKHEVTLTILKKTEDEVDINDFIKKSSQLPSDVKEAIGSLGSIKFDWLKIANHIPENKHTAEECEVMWNIFLHPKINKQKWTTKEDKKLNQIVEQYDCEDWDSIAKDLGTNRSGYQCFIRYNTNNWKNLMKGQSWSSNDDKVLTHLVSHLKIGDYIPWGYIASCMNNWTKQQVYFRWTYSLAPHLKKGRFSKEEDQQLLDAVEKYGLNFSKISALAMTNRTNIQLKEHYYTVIAKKQNNRKVWTPEDDNKLIELHRKYGSNWAKIIKEMTDFTRVQARQRFGAIMKCRLRGIPMRSKQNESEKSEISHTTVTYTNNTPWSRENKEIFVKFLNIDDQLINFFKKQIVNRPSNQLTNVDSPENSKEDAKKIFHILTKLNANLNMSINFDDDFDVIDIDPELLISFHDYIGEKRFKIFSDEVKNVVLNMFGSLEPASENDRFIPPLPFGFCPPKAKIKTTNSINYTARPNNNNNQLELNMVLEPNKYIAEYLGEDVDNQFEKLKRLFSTPTKSTKKVYSLKCKKFANTDLFLEAAKEDIDDIFPTCRRKKMKYDWEVNKMVSEDSSTEKVINIDNPSVSFIEPNRTTLQAYQEVLFTSENFPSDSDQSEMQHKLTHKGREALYLFKRRYEQLFHIPTGLSRVIPPDIVDESAFLPVVEKLKQKNIKPKILKNVKKK